MRTQTVHCAHCNKELTLAWDPERPTDVTYYCSWRCRTRIGNGKP